MSLDLNYKDLPSRRRFLLNSGMGLGTAALASLICRPVAGNSMMPERAHRVGPHFAPRAKRVIFLFMAGAPSQIDLFDRKPDLQKLFKEELPESVRHGQRVTAMTKGSTKLIAPSKFKFTRQGQSGVWMSELLPQLSTHADKLCLVHSLHTDAINHDPGKTSFCTGSEIPGKPSMGAWLSYGLGSLNQDLPDYVVMPSAFWSGHRFSGGEKETCPLVDAEMGRRMATSDVQRTPSTCQTLRQRRLGFSANRLAADATAVRKRR